jgi:hypothetical protein
MNEEEIRAHAVCAKCGKKIGHDNAATFFTLDIRRWLIDFDAVKRQSAFALMVGHSAIAQALGPNEDMAKSIGSVEITLCEECGFDPVAPIKLFEGAE